MQCQNFKAFVFSYQVGENELKTLMLTFDHNFNKIDQLQIAYDEIAESWLRTKCVISENKIEVKEYDESGGAIKTTTSIYTIDKNGKFVKISRKTE
ncbi:MAG: hypothetical protein HC913_22030 [Microscillaceae bacterium]|nr:hypothetical protein [Microscillaceae bacterium]